VESPSGARGIAIAMYCVLLLSYILMAADRYLFPVLAADVRKAFGFSLANTGLLATIFTLGLGVGGLPTGYLLTRFSSIWVVSGLGASVLAGLVGGGIVFLFLSRVLISHEELMDPADYEMVGVLGRVSDSIREKGTGEIIYSQAGTRRACGARCEDGKAVTKGTEVVVTRYEKGIAYVRLWAEMSGDQDQV